MELGLHFVQHDLGYGDLKAHYFGENQLSGDYRSSVMAPLVLSSLGPETLNGVLNWVSFRVLK